MATVMDDYKTLLTAAQVLPATSVRASALREVCRLADAANDTATGFQARSLLVQTASFLGLVPEALLAFVWQLAQCDREPDRFNERSLFFQFHWIIRDCVSSPTIELGQVNEMMDDLRRRLLRNNASLRSASHLRWRTLMQIGELDAAVEEQQRWHDYPRDHFCFNEACERDSEVELLVARGLDQQAIKHAEPLVSRELTSLSAVPHFTFANLLISCIRLGDRQRGQQYQEEGYSLIRSEHDMFFQHSRHLLFLIWVNDLERALRIFETQLPHFLASQNRYERAVFQWVCHLLFMRLCENAPMVKLSVPSDCELFCDSGHYDTEDLAESFAQNALADGRALDERNGNSHMIGLFDQYTAMLQGA